MATPTDNLNPPPAPSRVFYSLGRMLGAEDFQADQDYHRAALARALLQLCGTGTVAGLNVLIPQVLTQGNSYPLWGFVFDTNLNVQVNTGAAGISAGGVAFNETPGHKVAEGGSSVLVWTNYGALTTPATIPPAAPVANVWRPNSTFTPPYALVDSNGNVQVLTAAKTPFVSGPTPPVWSVAISSTTQDGNPVAAGVVPAWTCVGQSQLEVEVTAGLAIDRVGRMIESPSTVCILLQPWLDDQTTPDLTTALHGGADIVVDVFATFVPCTRGVTPCYASQDDYDATDAFSPNRLLDSFSMQLVLRTESSPALPSDPWFNVGAVPSSGVAAVVGDLQKSILQINAGPGSVQPFSGSGTKPNEYPASVDTSSVFLARITIPLTLQTGVAPTLGDPNAIKIDNFSRLFLYPASLVARTMGFSSGQET